MLTAIPRMWIRITGASVRLDDGRTAHTGEVVEVTEIEAQRLLQSGRAGFADAPADAVRSCSSRRDPSWKWGVP